MNKYVLINHAPFYIVFLFLTQTTFWRVTTGWREHHILLP